MPGNNPNAAKSSVASTPISPATERPGDGAQSPFDHKPYNRLIFHDLHGANQIPRYWVGGADGGPFSAENALKKAAEKHGANCFYCKEKLEKGEATIDHIEGRNFAGAKHIQNLVLACKPCNAKKGSQPIEAFQPKAGREWLQALLHQVEERLRKLG